MDDFILITVAAAFLLGGVVAWIDEFISPSGSFHEDLLSRSKRLAERWKSRAVSPS